MKFYRSVVGYTVAMVAFTVFVGLRSGWSNLDSWAVAIGVAGVVDLIVIARHEHRPWKERQFIKTVVHFPLDERRRRFQKYDARHR